MSYDLEIRSDDLYSVTSSLRRVTDILSLVPAVRQTSEITFGFEVESLNVYAEIYCEHLDDQGESTDLFAAQPNREGVAINCIRVCIPYAHVHQDKRDELYVLLGGEVAKHLGWKVVDLQTKTEQAATGDIRAVLESLT